MPKQKEMTITVAQARALQEAGVVLKIATLSQTMGPTWKDIVWLAGPGRQKTCCQSPSHTFAQINALLKA